MTFVGRLSTLIRLESLKNKVAVRFLMKKAGIAKYSPAHSHIPTAYISDVKCLKDEIMRIPGVMSVVLFGSYSRGDFTRDSDIDLAVFIPGNDPTVQKDVFRKCITCASDIALDIQILVFCADSLRDPVGIIEEIVIWGQDITRL